MYLQAYTSIKSGEAIALREGHYSSFVLYVDVA